LNNTPLYRLAWYRGYPRIIRNVNEEVGSGGWEFSDTGKFQSSPWARLSSSSPLLPSRSQQLHEHALPVARSGAVRFNYITEVCLFSRTSFSQFFHRSRSVQRVAPRHYVDYLGTHRPARMRPDAVSGLSSYTIPSHEILQHVTPDCLHLMHREFSKDGRNICGISWKTKFILIALRAAFVFKPFYDLCGHISWSKVLNIGRRPQSRWPIT